jgi:spartin
VKSENRLADIRLECISLPIHPEIGHQTANPFAPSPNDPAVPTHDFWLVLRVGPTFEMPLMPQQPITPVETASGIAYGVQSSEIKTARLEITLPSPGSAADLEDLDSFEVLLRQYGSLGKDVTALRNVTAPLLGSASHAPVPAPTSVISNEPRGGANTAPLPEEMRGKLVLVNEDNGEVVGELDQSIDIEDDKRIASDSKNKPVVLDFGDVMPGYAPKVKIQTVPQDELDDWMLRSAHEVR